MSKPKLFSAFDTADSNTFFTIFADFFVLKVSFSIAFATELPLTSLATSLTFCGDVL